MPLAEIVLVVVRLFAIQTFVQAAGLTMSVTGSLVILSVLPRDYVQYILPAALFVFAILEWVLAPVISRLVTRNHNPAIQFATLSREDVYSFAFVFLGLYFILISVAPAINWLHYYLLASARSGGLDEQSRKSFYDLASHLITLSAGILALVPARKWARILISRETNL